MDFHHKRAQYWKNMDPLKEAARKLGSPADIRATERLAERFAEHKEDYLTVLRQEMLDSYIGCSAETMHICLKRNLDASHLISRNNSSETDELLSIHSVKEVWGNAKKGLLFVFEHESRMIVSMHMYANWQGNPDLVSPHTGDYYHDIVRGYWNGEDGLYESFLRLEEHGEFLTNWQSAPPTIEDFSWAFAHLPEWAQDNLGL